MTRSGGKALVDQLELHGVELAFCVPGESYLPILDALHDSPIRLITCRHEAAAANMAEAYGKLTGRPGICFVTRGPGSTHAATGVHTADQDSTPMILFVGQVPRAHLGRDAFQELDYPVVFGSMTKWTAQVDDADRIPEHVSRAFSSALSARQGPVVLALPEDVLFDETDAVDAAVAEVPRAVPTDDQLRRLGELLGAAERPLVIVGEGGWSAQAGAAVTTFCEEHRVPVASSFRCQDYVDNRSESYAGPLTIGMDPALARRVEDADLLLAIGGRLGDVTTRGYTLLDVPRPRQKLVHVHPDPGELGRLYETDLAILGDVTELATALARVLPREEPPWLEWTREARADYLANLEHRRLPGELDMGDVMAFLRRRLPGNAVLTCGAGNFTVWAHRFYEFSEYGTQLAPQSGAMGYGLPAALAAKCVDRERIVVCIAGDGDFLMASSELATAMQHDLPVVVLIVDNGMYGTIRMHQESLYPGRVSGTELVNPDFAEYARSFGCFGESVERGADVEPAFERALASGHPAVVSLRVEQEAISPRRTISELQEGAG